MSKKITVALTIAEWNAVTSTISGELESLTDADEAGGIFDDLRSAQAALMKARHG